MAESRVSIAIPFYNAQDTLLDAVRSVFAQTHDEWELILLDDGSTDGSLELARAIRDPRVRVYSDGTNRRLAARLNQVTSLARHPFIARMDADDLMVPRRIEMLLSLLQENQHYDLASCGTYSIDGRGGLNGVRGSYENDYTFEGLLGKSQRFLHAGLVARREWYQRNRYDEALRVGQDTELWLRAAKAQDFRAISLSEPLYMYREEGNVTKSKLLSAYTMERHTIALLVDSPINRAKLIATSYAKSAIVTMLSRFGSLDYLLKRRNTGAPDQKVKDEFSSSYRTVLATGVPGVDDGQS